MVFWRRKKNVAGAPDSDDARTTSAQNADLGAAASARFESAPQDALEAVDDRAAEAPVVDFTSEFKPLMALALSALISPDLSADRAGWGAPSTRRIDDILAANEDALVEDGDDQDWRVDWDANRRAIALLQLVAKYNGADPSWIDGKWGRKSRTAYAACVAARDAARDLLRDEDQGAVIGSGASRPIDFDAEYKGLMSMAIAFVSHSDADDVPTGWGETSDRNVNEVLDQNVDLLPEAAREKDADGVVAWTKWSTNKKAVAAVQIITLKIGAQPGSIDGAWGPKTERAYLDAFYKAKHGVFPPPELDEPFELDVEIYPYEEMSTRHQQLIKDHWGDIGDVHAFTRGERAALRQGAVFEETTLGYLYSRDYAERHNATANAANKIPEELILPYTILWAFTEGARRRSDLDPVTRMRMHKDVRLSTNAVLKRVLDEYGYAEIKRLGLNIWGGSYNRRPMVTKSGEVTRWSLHAYGIAHDWDPANNGFSKRAPFASLSGPECYKWWRAWEEAGWWSFGRHKDKDYMHVQAAKRVWRAPT